MDVTLHPVQRTPSGDRLYGATISYPGGQRLELQSTISEDLHAKFAAWIARARGWFTEHIHRSSGPISGCSRTPGLCPHDVAGALFVGVSEALAQLPATCVEPEQVVAWSWDDYGVDYDRLVDDLTAPWSGEPMDFMGNGYRPPVRSPSRRTVVAPSIRVPKELYYAYALAST